jgi:hypothetical protein
MKLLVAIAPFLFFGLSIQAQTQTAIWAGPPVVKDAPYFADIISTYDRTTPSGERLHREMHSKIYRDTQGRTRRESEQTHPGTGQKLVSILINDPVSNTIISLDPRTMTARVRDGSAVALPKQSIRSKPESVTSAPVAPLGAPEPAVPAAESQRIELGTQTIDGLEVKGTKITILLPPAPGSNQQPRILVTSTWVSEELHIDVLTEIDEIPENHRTIRLVNIVRTEPDAELFKVPSGYTVVNIRQQE